MTLNISLGRNLLFKGVPIFFVIALLFFVNPVSYSQSNAVFDKQPVIEEAKKQLTAMVASKGELGEACRKNNITGTFVVDLTLEGKGKVVTVFMVSNEAAQIKDQNFLKNKIAELHFSNIKIPKKERVKSRHTLTF